MKARPRVAVIGAGISGLACALTLERHGIFPDIFEQRHRSGETFPHVGGILQLLNRPVKDQVAYLHQKLGLPIRPLARLQKVVMRAPNASGTVTGNLGYLFLRGQDEGSVESQLSSLLQSPVRYNCRADWRELSGKYDFVVVADGTEQAARTLGLWQEIISTWVRGAVVLGDFDPHTLLMWLNTSYCRHGYAYLTPFNQRRASLVLIVSGSNADEAEEMWRLFWQMEKLPYQEVEGFSLPHTSGYCYPPQVGNVLLAGNAGGFMEPFLGFGLMGAFKSGFLAGLAVAQGTPYTALTRGLRRQILQALSYRRLLNSLSDAHFNVLVKLLAAPPLKQLIYNTNIDIFKYGALTLDLIERIGQKIRPHNRRMPLP